MPARCVVGMLIVEDRDTGYFFTNSVAAGEFQQFSLIRVDIEDDVSDWQNENDSIWLINDTGDLIRVVTCSDQAMTGTGGWYPIPTPMVFGNQKEWDQYKLEMKL